MTASNILSQPPVNGGPVVEAVINGATPLDVEIEKHPKLRPLSASNLKITKNPNPTQLPEDMQFKWGATFTDHMLVITHDENEGWSDPEIKPYGPISLDPASSVLHYAPALFEGMKAYKSAKPGSEPVLFRPEMNMSRMRRSAERVQLPDFDPEVMIELISRLVKIDEHLIPPPPNALYLRPTMIGTRPTLGVAPSTHCMLYVICSPVGPFFPTRKLSADEPTPKYASQFTAVSLLATESATRAWPGGVGEFKLAGNYAPCFKPQMMALKRGYQQNLWTMHGKLSEAGQMNIFVVFRKGNEVEVATPDLDGTILPGVTRDSILSLLRSHAKSSSRLDIPDEFQVTVSERPITLDELIARSEAGEVLEAFGSGTAAVISPIKRIGFEDDRADLNVPEYDGGLGPIARGVFERLSQIQEGAILDHPWSRVVKN